MKKIIGFSAKLRSVIFRIKQKGGGVVVITKNESYKDLSGHKIQRRTVRQLKSEGKLVDSEDGLLPGRSQTLRLK